jgi:MOSC domain-containing protein YiiM
MTPPKTTALLMGKYAPGMASVLTVNLASPRPNADKGSQLTGIDKRPTDDTITVRAPGPMHGGLGSGLQGDMIGDTQVHGGDDQAVYAYAREDLDTWERELQRDLGNGEFGENLTTDRLDVTGARVGERWQVGSNGLVLEVSRPRIPCRTFATWLSIQGWVKTFTKAATPGAYLRVIESGTVRAGDSIVVVDRPNHDVTIGMVFRAMTLEPELLPRVLEADALPDEIKELARPPRHLLTAQAVRATVTYRKA